MVSLETKLYSGYDLIPSTFSNWIKKYQNTGSFNHQDNLTSDEKS